MIRKPPIFKYSHKDKLNLASNQKITIAVLLISSLFFILINVPTSIFIFIFTIIYAIVIYPKRNILITSRYLICGNTIFYYKNINKIVLNYNSGILLIYSDDKEVFRLEKELFPTNARKPLKITNNKNNKFKKVSDKIIDNIKKAAPDVELHV